MVRDAGYLHGHTDPFSISTLVACTNNGMSDPIAVGVDVGGTFTDAVIEVPGEPTTVVKVPTSSPPTDGILEAIERACDEVGVPLAAIDRFRHGSTVATNALLERNGAETALITTTGFRDVLEIGRQDRPTLYDLAAARPEPLVPRHRRYELDERMPPPTHPDPALIRTPPATAALEAVADDVADAEAVAVSLLHADIDPQHEQLVAEYLRDRLDGPVIPSHEVDPTFREYERTATTVASAYLTPMLSSYLDRLGAACDERGIPAPWVMQSNGGIASPAAINRRAVSTVLSGPAAGVVGAMAALGSDLDGSNGAITLDIGGTSTDVSLIDEAGPQRTTDTTVGGVPIRVPTVDIHTVGAGGGSIAWVDAGGALRVGPNSARADPGPACYDRGGVDPTVTDAAVVLGLIGSDRPLGGQLPVNADAAYTVMGELAAAAGLTDATEAAIGTYRVAVESIAQAIRRITVERGRDPRSDHLLAFGGAGGMVAAAIADRLDIETIVIPAHSGIQSAVGLISADERHDVAHGIYTELAEETVDELDATFARLESDAIDRCSGHDRAELNRIADVRYAGQSYELSIPMDDPVSVAAAVHRFETEHRRLRGYSLDDRIDVIACRVEAVVPTALDAVARSRDDASVVDTRTVTTPPWSTGEYDVYAGVPRSTDRPSIIERSHTTIAIPPGWSMDTVEDRLVLSRRRSR